MFRKVLFLFVIVGLIVSGSTACKKKEASTEGGTVEEAPAVKMDVKGAAAPEAPAPAPTPAAPPPPPAAPSAPPSAGMGMPGSAPSMAPGMMHASSSPRRLLLLAAKEHLPCPKW
jgi:hypothetical protein